MNLLGFLTNKKAFRFKNIPYGRYGLIECRKGSNVININWEMSGAPEFDILLAPLDLREWSSPIGISIDQSVQLQILSELRAWLMRNRIKTDIDVYDFKKSRSRTCEFQGCQNVAYLDKAFCEYHYDLILLRY